MVEEINEENHKSQLRDFLFSYLLEDVEPNQTKRRNLIDDHLDKWVIAFTHESYNPNLGQNYEELEKLGDTAMKTAFTEFLLKNYPKLDRGAISELSNKYLAKEEQANMSSILQLEKFVLTYFPHNKQMKEDLLESVFGVTLLIGNQIELGLGYKYIYRLFEKISNLVKIDPTSIKGSAKTQVLQLIQKVTSEKVEESYDVKTRTYNIILRPEIRKALDQFSNKPVPRVLALATGKTKKVAEIAAYELALRKFSELGITVEKINALRTDIEFEAAEFTPYLLDLIKRKMLYGITNYSFKNIRGDEKGFRVQLIGEKDGVLTTLGIGMGDNIIEAKVQAVENFLIETQEEADQYDIVS